MRIISLDELLIPENRQRKHFAEKPLADLRESILSKGLLHPPVVQKTEDGYVLVAGERRTRAICALADLDLSFACDGKVIQPGYIPVILLSDLSPLEVREAELEENIIREPLTWQEQANAIAELHALRSEQAEEKGTVQTATATATEIKGTGETAVGSEVTRVTEAVIIAKHLDDPEISSAKSQKEALKIIRRKMEAEHREKLAREFDKKSTPHTLHLGDSLQLLSTLPSDEFNLIITDPPYGIGADGFGSMASTGHEYKDSSDYALMCYEVLAKEGHRVTKSSAVLYAFFDIRFFSDISMTFTLAGWDVWSTPLIWSKRNGMLPKPDHGPRRTYEAILMATKGSPRFFKTGAPDVLEFPQESSISHGAQKPVALLVELISRSALPGAKILDPFAGSGSIFPAATTTKCVATGIEINQEYYNLAISRISGSIATDLGDLL